MTALRFLNQFLNQFQKQPQTAGSAVGLRLFFRPAAGFSPSTQNLHENDIRREEYVSLISKNMNLDLLYCD